MTVNLTTTITVIGDWATPVTSVSTVEVLSVGYAEPHEIAAAWDRAAAKDFLASLAPSQVHWSDRPLPTGWRMAFDAGLIDDRAPGLYLYAALDDAQPIGQITATGVNVLGHFRYAPERGLYAEGENATGLLFDLAPVQPPTTGPQFVVPVTITTSWNHEVVMAAQDADDARRKVGQGLDDHDICTLPGHRLISSSTGVDIGFAFEA